VIQTLVQQCMWYMPTNFLSFDQVWSTRLWIETKKL
jgi:hypothetical protein